MKNRSIALLALIQLGAVFYAILVTGVFCKIGKFPLESGGYPPPSGYLWAVTFRDYGILLVFSVIAWTIFAAIRTNPPSHDEISWRVLASSGGGLAFLYFLAGTFFALCAMTPFISLH